METFKPIPITLITGYLGSGKTTLINHILTNAKSHKIAVIVNDIGEVNIDAELIEAGGVVSSGEDNLVALSNGCICCTLKEDLIKQLADLVNSRKFDHILIEASGICEPVPIAQTITYMTDEFKDRNLPLFYYLDAVISVTDALRLKEEFGYGEKLERKEEDEEDIESLIIQQLEFCDIILLNKASELTLEERKRVKAAIRAIQPEAKIIETDYAQIDIDEIVDVHLFDFDKASTSAAWVKEFNDIDNEHEDHDEEEEEHHHHHHHHEHGVDHNDDEGTAEEYGIQTFVYYRRRPFSKLKFAEWLRSNPHKIIRSKGIVYFKNNPVDAFLYESAGSQINVSKFGEWFSESHSAKDVQYLLRTNEDYARTFDETYLDKYIKVVFIGQDLNVKQIRSELDNL